jgi:acid phosphatase (class A)
MAAIAALTLALALHAEPSAAADGYLPKSAIPDTTAVLPPPPAPGTGVDADDHAAFRSSRALKYTPRWSMAIGDVEQTPEAAFLDFACALGVTLDDGSAPTLSNMFSRIRVDARGVVDPPKDHYARHRPYLDQEGDICVEKTPSLAASASYPSGHSTLSWAWGLILAELAPDRATEILARARAYAESRVVCGVHYPSDIEAGRANGSILVAALHASSDFRADMEKARAELAAARKSGGTVKPDPGQCRIEEDAETHRPW